MTPTWQTNRLKHRYSIGQPSILLPVA